MDIFLIEAVVAELRQRLTGARLDKVHQPGAATLILRFWTGRAEERLLLSAAPGEGRLHLTGTSPPNPPHPPRFCQLLRARLSRLLEIRQLPQERIVEFLFRGTQGENLRLVAEFTGKQTNLLLLDGEGVIIDLLQRVAAGEGRRELLPAHPYRAPEVRSGHLLAEGLPPIPGECDEPHSFRSWLLKEVRPMSPLIAEELAARVAGGVSPESALADFRRRWLAHDFQPMIAQLAGKPVLSAFALSALPLREGEEFASPSAAVERFYAVAQNAAVGRRGELATLLRRELKRLDKRLQNIEKESRSEEELDLGRRLGDLLLANLHRLRKGMAEVVVEDWFGDPPAPVTIRLDPRLTPQENAEQYFRGFKKGKRGAEHIMRRREETLQQRQWLEELELALEEAETAPDLEALRQELREAGLLREPAPPRHRAAPSPQTMVRRAVSPGGLVVLWGRNSRSNDHLSRELTAADDLWFHAHGQPGSHVVLKRGTHRGEILQADLLFAAAVAAGYSRGKESPKVEVMVTEGKWVRRPKGARLGLVTVEQYRTVMVEPLRLEENSS